MNHATMYVDQRPFGPVVRVRTGKGRRATHAQSAIYLAQRSSRHPYFSRTAQKNRQSGPCRRRPPSSLRGAWQGGLVRIAMKSRRGPPRAAPPARAANRGFLPTQ
jgi:hypothetical protein